MQHRLTFQRCFQLQSLRRKVLCCPLLPQIKPRRMTALYIHTRSIPCKNCRANFLVYRRNGKVTTRPMMPPMMTHSSTYMLTRIQSLGASKLVTLHLDRPLHTSCMMYKTYRHLQTRFRHQPPYTPRGERSHHISARPFRCLNCHKRL